MSVEHIFRVTVRGQFDALDEKSRARLIREQPDHDIFKSAYTTEGTFTYDKDVLFFNLRYEVRTAEGSAAAESTGVREAELFLRTLGFGFKKLKVNVVDTSTAWQN